MVNNQILKYPDPRLSECSKLVPHGSYISDTIEQMQDAFIQQPAMGLAAIQIGIPQQIFLFCPVSANNPTGGYVPSRDGLHLDEMVVCVNPRYIAASPLEKSPWPEECLSIPGYSCYKKRPKRITLEYWDLNWNRVVSKFEGLNAVCVAHEMDHLVGRLIND